MSSRRAGIDLHLAPLPSRSARALTEALRDAIAAGRLAPGSRLPSARQLAAEVGLSKNTVAEVYAGLAAEGVLRTEIGAGTWVSDHHAAQPAAMDGRAARPRLDLRAGLADASDFPAAKWAEAAAAALRHTAAVAGYAPAAGDPMLRAELAVYLGRTRGCDVNGATAVTGHGFGELLAMAARTLLARGIDTIAVEEYGHQSHRDILATAGLRLVPLPVDHEGAQVGRLDGSRARAALLTPAHQFPTGFALSDPRRQQLAAWAEHVDGVILEDDYDGEFRFDRRAVGALQPLAAQRVIYLGTASKALSPAIGLAWALAPAALAAEMTEHRGYAGAAPSGLHERTLAHFIAAHEYDRAVRARRISFRRRRESFAELLAQHAPRCRIEGQRAGLHCLVQLPADASERGRGDAASTVAALARAAGVAVDPLPHFRFPGDAARDELAPPHFGDALVVGFGAAAPAAADEALRRLVAVIGRYAGGK
jgi:GntR family transcriptional regulator/MocR family aminotransferase